VEALNRVAPEVGEVLDPRQRERQPAQCLGVSRWLPGLPAPPGFPYSAASTSLFSIR
jgi:hypothetical protein